MSRLRSYFQFLRGSRTAAGNGAALDSTFQVQVTEDQQPDQQPEQPADDQLPSEQPRSDETPSDQLPSEETTPSEGPPAEDQLPPEEQPTDQLPSEEPPSEEPPAEDQLPPEEQPTDQLPSEEPPSEEPPAEDQLPPEQPPTDEQPSSEIPPTDADDGEDVPKPQPKPLSKKEQNKQQNIDEGTKKFGSTGSDFATLKGADKLNDRQKQIFDEKLKKAIEKDKRANKGPMSDADLKKLAQKAADVADSLSKTKLSKAVNDLSLKSETLKDNIVDLQNRGWKIKVGKRGKGSFTDKAAKTITMDPSQSTKDLVEGLAHETGHAEYTAPPDPSVDDKNPDVAKGREYIRKVVENALLDEGQAQIVACKTAKELVDKGETDINIPGGHSDEYKDVYKKIVDGTISMDEGRKQMAKIMGGETTSNSNENYVDYYSKAPRKAWNKAHKNAKVPATPRVDVFP
jgi:hypothetical protein